MATTTLTQNPELEQQAHDELERILDAIAAQMGTARAFHAAQELHSAARHARIDGRDYAISDYDRYDPDETQTYHCAIGTLARALDLEVMCGFTPEGLPGWEARTYSPFVTPLEMFVRDVRYGDSYADSQELNALVAWTNAWLARTTRAQLQPA